MNTLLSNRFLNILAFVAMAILAFSLARAALATDPNEGQYPPEPTNTAPPGQSKVPICHKPGAPAEKTLYVPPAAVDGHLRHGDALGECAATEPVEETTYTPPEETIIEEPTMPTTVIASPPPEEPTMVEPTNASPEPTMSSPEPTMPTSPEPTVASPEPTMPPDAPNPPSNPDNPPDNENPDKPGESVDKPDRPDNAADTPGDNVVVVNTPGQVSPAPITVTVTETTILAETPGRSFEVARTDLDADGTITNVEDRAMVVAGETASVDAVLRNTAATRIQSEAAVDHASRRVDARLPETGGVPLLPLGAVVLGSALIAFRLVRQRG